jgi:hypothetical protein
MSRARRINQWLWQHVERYQRRPRWQRVAINVFWVVVGVSVVYLWTSAWDCPIC